MVNEIPIMDQHDYSIMFQPDYSIMAGPIQGVSESALHQGPPIYILIRQIKLILFYRLEVPLEFYYSVIALGCFHG